MLFAKTNIITLYVEVPELIEKKTQEIVDASLLESKDDFNFVN
ncbi:DNA polymerase III subunit delta, partial [Staphylococcus condimenti]